MSRFPTLFPSRRINAQHAVERAEGEAAGEPEQEAQEAPPADGLHAEEKHHAPENEPGTGIEGSNVFLHRGEGVEGSLHPDEPVRRAGIAVQ